MFDTYRPYQKTTPVSTSPIIGTGIGEGTVGEVTEEKLRGEIHILQIFDRCGQSSHHPTSPRNHQPLVKWVSS